MDTIQPYPDDDGPLSDLEARLAKYRARVAAEGRKSALRSIDRAIDEARRRSERDDGEVPAPA